MFSSEARPPEPPHLDDLEMRIGVHDVSRLEWVTSIELPKRDERKYEIEFSLEIPANIFLPHNVWDYMQTYTRLQSPTEEGELRVDRHDIDELRRDTLGVAHRLKAYRQKFESACASAAASLIGALQPTLEASLSEWIALATELLGEMRQCLQGPLPDGTTTGESSAREAELADEFLSHQLLEFLAAAQKSLDEVLLAPGSRMLELNTGFAERLHRLLSEQLRTELGYRQARGYLNPSAKSSAELSRFVERGSRLKKHFQDVLFLDGTPHMVDFRVRNWTGVVAAAIAAVFWLAFTVAAPLGSRAWYGVSMLTFGLIFAAAYALKDRMKELTRAWLAGRLMRLYGHRMATLRLPGRFDAERRVLVETREICECRPEVREDLLNRTVGRTRRVVVLRYHMRVELKPSDMLQKGGIRCVKHIFRYDLSPVFGRLDNAVKRVPVLDEATAKVRLADAPKEYRVPVSVRATIEGRAVHSSAELVLSKRGIERIEHDSEHCSID